jgi:LacI family transcriptional regulator
LAAIGMLARYPDLIGIYTTCGGTAGIGHALQESGQARQTIFVAHGLSAEARELLAEQVLDVVLDQDTRGIVHSAGIAALNLVNDVRGSLALPKPMVQIYLRENAHS